uniref:ARAD1A03938p n=1 Tax=Blastobotrys adeninivorans TaxID=409370 RepID=A0A060SXI5_BLAAD
MSQDMEKIESSSTSGDVESSPVPYTGPQSGEANYERELDREEEYQLERLVSGSRESHVSHKGIKLRMGGSKPIPPMVPKTDYIVEFDGPEDPLHPKNRTLREKLTACIFLGLTTCTVSWGSAIFATAIPAVAQEFHVGQVVATLGISLYIAGFAAGPILWGSLSELVGRKGPILVSQFGFVLFSFATATAKDFQTVMLCRFFAGFIGSAPLAVIGGAYTDMFSHQARGKSMVGYLSMVFVGPTIAPVVGGFISASYLGWRWTEYITGIMGSFVLVMDYFFYEESYYPIVLVKKAKRLREQTGNWAIHAVAEQKNLDLNRILQNSILRPLHYLTTQPIVFLIAIYISFVYGILYLCLEVYPLIFMGGYGFTGGKAELPYLGILVGMFIGGAYLLTFEPRYGRKVDQNGGRPCPDARLDAMLLPAVCFPIGLFWLTWTGNCPQHIHWIVPTLAGLFIGFALMGIFLSAICYMVESYLPVVASVMAANAFLRAAFASSFPLFAKAMFNNMGINWAGTLLGCLATIMVPIPFVFRIYAPALKKTIKF